MKPVLKEQTLDFTVSCNPPKSTAQGSSKIMKNNAGKMFVGKSSSSKATAAKTHLLLLLQKDAPTSMFVGPVEIAILWVYPWNASEKKADLAMGIVPHWKKPDADNILKALLDVMTTLAYWKDDAQISDLIFRKRKGDKPGISIQIKGHVEVQQEELL